MILKEYLDVNGIKYERFAQKINISRVALSYIMNRKRDLRLSVAIRIVEATNGEVSYKELLPYPPRDKKEKKDSSSPNSYAKPKSTKKAAKQ